MKPARPSPAVTRGKPKKSSGSGPAPGSAAASDSIDLTPLVSEVIGTGADAHRLVHVGGWTITARGSDDPALEIPDAALAQGLGVQIKHLRELSARYEASGDIAPRKVDRGGDANKSCGTTYSRGRGRPGVQRFYSEAEALFLVTRASSKRAVALTKEMIAVYMAARRGLLRPVAAPAPVGLDPAVRAALEILPVLVEQTKTLASVMERHEAQLAALAGHVASHSAELASGIIGPEKAREIRVRIYDAARRASGGDKGLAARFRTGRSTWIRNAVQFTGPRSHWRNLPRAALAKVETLLDAVERDADALAREIRESKANAAAKKQADLPFKPN